MEPNTNPTNPRPAISPTVTSKVGRSETGIRSLENSSAFSQATSRDMMVPIMRADPANTFGLSFPLLKGFASESQKDDKVDDNDVVVVVVVEEPDKTSSEKGIIVIFVIMSIIEFCDSQGISRFMFMFMTISVAVAVVKSENSANLNSVLVAIIDVCVVVVLILQAEQ